MNSTRAPSSDVRTFDVRRDTRPAIAPLRGLRRLHATLAQHVADAWSETLRAEVEAECVLVETVASGDYLRGLPSITVLGRTELAPLPGEVLIEFDAALGLLAVDRLLGGGGGTSPELRAPTAIEAELLRTLIDQIGAGLARTLSPVVPVSTRLGELVLEPAFLRLGAPMDPVTLVAFRLRVVTEGVASEGTLTLCYPGATLAPVLEALGTEEATPTTGAPVTDGPLAPVLPAIDVAFTVRLDATRVAARDLVSLQPGDVLRLDHRVGSDVHVEADGRRVVAGQLGRKGVRLALQVTTPPATLATGVRGGSQEVPPPAPDGEHLPAPHDADQHRLDPWSPGGDPAAPTHQDLPNGATDVH